MLTYNQTAAPEQTTDSRFMLAGGYRTETELASAGIRDLRRLASQRGLRGGSRMRKDVLVEALFAQQEAHLNEGREQGAARA